MARLERTALLLAIVANVPSTRLVSLHLGGDQILELEVVRFGWTSGAFTTITMGLTTNRDILVNPLTDFQFVFNDVGLVAYVNFEVLVATAVGQQFLVMPVEYRTGRRVSGDLVAWAFTSSGSTPTVRIDLEGNTIRVSKAEKMAILGQQGRERRV